MTKISTHGYILTREAGKYAGVLITRVSVRCLIRLANDVPALSGHAKAELERRQTSLVTVFLSGHAVDQASLRLIKQWHDMRKRGEGLHSWLARIAAQALVKGQYLRDECTIKYKKMIFVFDISVDIPVLKTVMIGSPKYKSPRSGDTLPKYKRKNNDNDSRG